MLRTLRRQLKDYAFATGGRCYDNSLVIPEMRLQIDRVKKTLENYNQYSHCPDKFKHKQIQISDYAMKYGLKWKGEIMSDMEMEKLWEKLYEEHLEQVLKKIKDVEKAEQEARLLTDEQVENMQWKKHKMVE